MDITSPEALCIEHSFSYLTYLTLTNLDQLSKLARYSYSRQRRLLLGGRFSEFPLLPLQQPPAPDCPIWNPLPGRKYINGGVLPRIISHPPPRRSSSPANLPMSQRLNGPIIQPPAASRPRPHIFQPATASEHRLAPRRQDRFYFYFIFIF